MAPSKPNVLRKASRIQQEHGMTFAELQTLFTMHEYGPNKAKWAVMEMIHGGLLQTSKKRKNTYGNYLYFSAFWPFSGLKIDYDQICPVEWGRRREFVKRIDGRDFETPWILEEA